MLNILWQTVSTGNKIENEDAKFLYEHACFISKTPLQWSS